MPRKKAAVAEDNLRSAAVAIGTAIGNLAHRIGIASAPDATGGPARKVSKKTIGSVPATRALKKVAPTKVAVKHTVANKRTAKTK